MALTYNGTADGRVNDRPAGATNTQPAAVASPEYTDQIYSFDIDKATVDTTGVEGTNYDALIAAIDAQMAVELADFDLTANVEAVGEIITLQLVAGSRYLNDNTPVYRVTVKADIAIS
jgi:hypothetical protein